MVGNANALSEITSLQNTLNAALDAYKAELAAQNLPEPSLNTSKPHPTDDITFLLTPTLYEARKAALASVGLLKLLIQSPHDAVVENTYLPFEQNGLYLAHQLGLPDLLGDSEEGLSIEEIVKKTGVDGPKLERVLRLLIINGWFRETKPSYYANSRFSNIIKKNGPGYVFPNYMNDFMTKISSKIPEHINHPDPKFRLSNAPQHSAFQLAYDTEIPLFGDDGWYSQHTEERTNFGIFMGALSPLTDPGVAADFPWAQYAAGKDAIVDVGGGQGTLSCSLSLRYPEIKKFIVQDIPSMKTPADANIASKGLQGRVEFLGEDFFLPRQDKGKYGYVIQRVLHDWNDVDAGRILKSIKDVLHADSSILIIENIIGSGVRSPAGEDVAKGLANVKQQSAYKAITPPPFVPGDFGEASRTQRLIEVAVIGVCNAYDRTLPEFDSLAKSVGLKIKNVYPTRGWGSVMELVPV